MIDFLLRLRACWWIMSRNTAFTLEWREDALPGRERRVVRMVTAPGPSAGGTGPDMEFRPVVMR